MKKEEFKIYLEKLEKSFESCGKPFPAEEEKRRWLANYKNSNPNFKLYNHSKKEWESELKDFYLSLEGVSSSDLDKFFLWLYKNTQYDELGHAAINHFKKKQKKKTPELIRFWSGLKTWTARIDHWAHADMIASLYCDILSEDPKTVLPTLEKWAQGKDPWKARMGIVSLFYYYNPKRFHPPVKTVVASLTPHLERDHYYLQKAIGWCLREFSRAYPKDYERFMKKNLSKISSTAFSTAVEKCPSALKESWKKTRKELRKKVK